MRFVYPQFLWALLLVILPILIHLFNFRKHKQLYFSSLQFVKAVETSDRKRKNILHLLILLSRILAIVFIVLAFAQPYFSKNANTNSSEAVYAIYIDNSASMSLSGVSGNLMSEARENARKLIQQLPADGKFLVHSNLLSAEEGRLSSREEVLSRIDFIELSNIQQSKGNIIDWQKMQIKLEKPNALIHHYLLSDFQKHDSDLSTINPDSIHYYHPIVHKPQSKKNLTLDTLYFESPIHQTGVTTHLIYGVRNYSDEPAKGVEINLEVGLIKRKLTIDVPANSRVEDKISYVDFSPGLIKGNMTIQDFPFELDNTLYFSYEIKSEIKICILSGPLSYKLFPTLFSLDKQYKTVELSVNSVNREQLLSNDFIIVNGIEDLTQGVADDLVYFAANGGSVAVIPSDKTLLSSTNILLSNLKLPSLNSFQKGNFKINSIQQKDAFFTGVFVNPNEQISLPGVNNYFSVQPNNSNALALVSLQNNAGLFFKHNKHPFYLLTTSIEDAQNAFTKDALFPTLFLRMAEQANQSPFIYTEMGLNGYYPLKKIADPNLPIYLIKDDFKFIPMRVTENGTTFLNLKDPEAVSQLKPGIYSIEQNKTILDHIALNLDRRESNTDSYTLVEIEYNLQKQNVQNIQGISIDKESDKVHIPISNEPKWWKYCLILSLLFILAELFLLIYGKNLRRIDK